MYIGVVLLCQAHFAHHTLFLVLMPNLCLVLKILQKLKALVLMMKLLMQKLPSSEAGELAGDDGRAHSASPSEDTNAGHPKGTRSTVRKCSSSSQATSHR